MIAVVADTSPVSYLVRIGEIDLLKKLYGQIILPSEVLQELLAEDGPMVVRDWARSLPAWVRVQSPERPLTLALPQLHRGESQAIALTEELRAALLLMDDRVGVQVALERGLTLTGTLGVLVEGAQAGLLPIGAALRKLQETNFRATPELYRRAFEMASLDPPVLPRRKKE